MSNSNTEIDHLRCPECGSNEGWFEQRHNIFKQYYNWRGGKVYQGRPQITKHCSACGVDISLYIDKVITDMPEYRPYEPRKQYDQPRQQNYDNRPSNLRPQRYQRPNPPKRFEWNR